MYRTVNIIISISTIILWFVFTWGYVDVRTLLGFGVCYTAMTLLLNCIKNVL